MINGLLEYWSAGVSGGDEVFGTAQLYKVCGEIKIIFSAW